MAPKSSSTFIIIDKLEHNKLFANDIIESTIESQFMVDTWIDILKTALYVLLENIILFLVYYYSNIK
jgi:hypothetical protein